jgi:hypothetical protein
MSDASDNDLAFLQRLSQPLERITSILRKLVQKKHPAMSQADFPRPWWPPAAKQSGRRDRVMRGSKRRHVNEWSLR